MKTMKMNMLSLIIPSLAAMTFCGVASAGTLPNVPNDFQAGTPAVANEVNDNFVAVVDEINDNAANITTNASGVATNTSGVAANSSGISTNTSGVAANASSTSTNALGVAANAGDISTNAQAIGISEAAILSLDARVSDLEVPIGHSSVSGIGFLGFDHPSEDCNLYRGSLSFIMALGTSTACDGVAPIQLPDGVDIAALTCTVLDNTATGPLRVNLQRIDFASSGRTTLFSAETAGASAQHVEIIDDTISDPLDGLIDNSAYAYQLWAEFGTGVAPGVQMRIYGCSVSY